ncbi:MAG: mechanosensitive ion channel [Bacteroidales bacterium]|nr:mechanosensitive ion channel [Bacteroidales bacterium]
MKPFQLQLLQTIIMLVTLAATKILLRSIVNKFMNKFHFALERKRIISKIINFFIIMVGFVVVIAIWGVDSQQVILFITSALTILGIGFFAQWSILSNITSSLILFFNHPIRIGGHIRILDKDYPIEGVVENISLFFMYIRTHDNQLVSIPNTVILQKTISLLEDDPKE